MIFPASSRGQARRGQAVTSVSPLHEDKVVTGWRFSVPTRARLGDSWS